MKYMLSAAFDMNSHSILNENKYEYEAMGIHFSVIQVR
jgi:hypothetical protein